MVVSVMQMRRGRKSKSSHRALYVPRWMDEALDAVFDVQREWEVAPTMLKSNCIQ